MVAGVRGSLGLDAARHVELGPDPEPGLATTLHLSMEGHNALAQIRAHLIAIHSVVVSIPQSII